MTERSRYDSLFEHYVAALMPPGTDWRELKAQAIAESNLDPTATSGVGAQGLMQFMAPTWMEWQARIRPGKPPAPRTDPERSIETGAAYMAHLLAMFHGDRAAALAAYNWGLGHMKRHLEENDGRLCIEKLPHETQHYLERIAATYSELASGIG